MTPPLTRDRLLAAALSLVDEEGAEALTMRSLASRVDRQVSSLYNHVSGRTELVELMRSKVVERIDVGPFARLPWDLALGEWARSYLMAFAQHPHLIRLLATTPIRDESTLAMYNEVVRALTGAGWAAGESIAVLRTVEAHVLGSALDIVAPGNMLDAAAVPEGLKELRAALAIEHHSAGAAEAAFDLGLEALIVGLRARNGAPAS
ncbi:MAG: TetR/AcrR family transcriptional regulator C-terminal domain-containing protein [Arthrobacter sp.]|jgi:AcrR family transcriptional regulator|nr:TetR/AcrR family transcriptional regulator C-terminal domain-containing protein [Arthrobacter sp.]